MPFLLELPNEYSYVLAVASSTFFINTLHGALTGKARKASGITYPAAYATNEVAEKDRNAYLFNCTQRAHANFTENHTPFLGALLIAGLRWPVASASLGALWALSRVAYAVGYSGSGPKGRMTGFVGWFLTGTALQVMAAITSAKFIMAQ